MKPLTKGRTRRWTSATVVFHPEGKSISCARPKCQRFKIYRCRRLQNTVSSNHVCHGNFLDCIFSFLLVTGCMVAMCGTFPAILISPRLDWFQIMSEGNKFVSQELLKFSSKNYYEIVYNVNRNHKKSRTLVFFWVHISQELPSRFCKQCRILLSLGTHFL